MTNTSKPLKILADENFAAVHSLFDEFGVIQTKAGREITNEDLKDVDVLLVRSVTKVNEALLKNTPVRFVGTATIGTDHIDINYLKQNDITFASAPGCNAQAVAEYVVNATLAVRPEAIYAEKDFTLGIIGLGNIGSRLAGLANKIGWNVIGYDPFKNLPNVKSTSLDDSLQNSHAVSLHVPFTTFGPYPTHHLIEGSKLALMPSEAILINSSRGGVVDESALLKDIGESGRKYIADVFENEPQMDENTLDHFTLVTPHIAGYSQEGKLRGSAQIYQALAKWLNRPANQNWRDYLPQAPYIFSDQLSFNENLSQSLKKAYNIYEDDISLRDIAISGRVHSKDFDNLRKNYPLRFEWQTLGLLGAEQ